MTHLPAIEQSPYAGIAELYDSWVYDSRYRAWIVGLAGLARQHGLPGQRALDIGCGTGSSILPLVDLGFEVTGCDPAGEMLAVARGRVGEGVSLVEAGLPDLPVLGEFDLALAANDIFNHLLDTGDVHASMAAVAANLAPGGVLVLDANTLATYRGFFATDHCRDRETAVFAWRGLADRGFASGMVAEGILDAFARGPGECWRRTSIRLVQRHHPHELVRDALTGAGLEIHAVLGQHDDGSRDPTVEELRHTKRIYVARRP